jgi:hypothetical protein
LTESCLKPYIQQANMPTLKDYRVSIIDINTLDNLKPPPFNTLIHVLHCIGEMALAPLVESHLLLNEEWWGEKGKFIYLLPRPATIYIDLALRAMFPSLHASIGRSPVWRIHSIEIDGINQECTYQRQLHSPQGEQHSHKDPIRSQQNHTGSCSAPVHSSCTTKLPHLNLNNPESATMHELIYP